MNEYELIDAIRPEHDRTTCSDTDGTNGFYSAGVRDGNTDTLRADGRCLRCMLLELAHGTTSNGEPIPEDGPEHIQNDW